jgi:hypothetical protein
MKFFRNRYKTRVRTRPETIVPVIESSGFFMGLFSSGEIHASGEIRASAEIHGRGNPACIPAYPRVA